MARASKAVKVVEEAGAAALLEETQSRQAMEAYLLRQKGTSWWDIAEELKLTENGARMAVDRAIATASSMVGDHVKRQLLTLEVDRLDALMMAHWDSATTVRTHSDAEGNIISENPDIAAGRFILSVISERAKLLGLYDMSTVTVTQQTVVVAGTSEEYIAALRLISSGGKIIEGETA